ncbi:MAG: hypothetical protein CM15mP84_09770 [Cellvibrionales bacterium]|nr:MAG: hypothetical protein CM15mP84_09770 [Cellvibrionales bacterium]
MQYLIALAVALLSGRSYLAVAPKLWCVGHQEGFGVSRLCGRTGVIAGQSGTSQVGATKSVLSVACLLYSSAPTFPDGEIQC